MATDTAPAFELIGREGQFRLSGGRTIYEAVMYNESSARSDRVRLARIDTANGIRQINRWVDWHQPIEVIELSDDGDE